MTEALQRPIEELRKQALLDLEKPRPITNVGSLGFGVFRGFSAGVFPVPGPELPVVRERHFLGQPRLVTTGYRIREIEWRRNHAEDLRALAGQWVALEEENIVAHGRDALEVVRETRARGIKKPYIFYVESVGDDVVQIGL